MQGQCPHCKGLYEAQPEWTGQQTQCPHCHQTIVVAPLLQQQPQPFPMPTDPSAFSRPQIAGIGERFLAAILDGIISGSIAFVVALVVVMYVQHREVSYTALQDMSKMIGFVVGLLYETYFISSHGATPGKMALHLKVQHNGQNPSTCRALVRYFAKGIGGAICFIGYFIAFFNSNHKALHDMVCDTFVVKE